MQCDDGGNTATDTYTTVAYTREVFIGANRVFNGERFNRPMVVRKNQDNEIIVLDAGNRCLYVFDNEGKFVRKIGRPEEAPGSLRNPVAFEIDTDGDIYVYEWGNKKMSIFSKDGTFINSFEVTGSNRPVFTVTDDKKILMNLESSGYFITVISRDGEIEKEIGPIREYVGKDLEPINMIYLEGIPFMRSNGHYCIYVASLGSMLIFDDDGKLVQDHLMENIPDVMAKDQYLLTPEKIAEGPKDYFYYFHDIIVRNDRMFFVLNDIEATRRRENIFAVYELDNDFKIIKKMYLPVLSQFSYQLRDVIRLAITDNEDEIYFALGNSAEVFRFTHQKNE